MESEPEFLTRVLKGIDRWFTDDSNLDQARQLITGRLHTLTTQPGHPADTDPDDPILELVATELHRLRRADATVTIRTRGGFSHHDLRINAVRRHHIVVHYVHHGDCPGFLLPLAYIESIHPLPDPSHGPDPTTRPSPAVVPGPPHHEPSRHR
ncbi:hypothetical protein ACFYV7_39190 [Nocardia suismassiliense]|uniref:Uncharacterized protein n=1 Tax=Nocardia suismassiliense TaxID=2077092 RepID=A0ABW6R5S7_9NOCA